MKNIAVIILLLVINYHGQAQEGLITNINGRETKSLNGSWYYIIDPYETGFYDYRYQERNENDVEAYWSRPQEEKKEDRIEHGYEEPYTLQVPGDWNSQADVFKYYEGTVWYQRSFDLDDLDKNERYFLYFGAVNYEAHVYLNEKKIGSHKGGFTPFNFEVPKELLQKEDNFLVVKVDNKRHPEEIPTVNTDWWNFGGITRDVALIKLPNNFIEDYTLQLSHDQDIERSERKNQFSISGGFKVNESADSNAKVSLEIPELKFNKEFTKDAISEFEFNVKNLELWSPENPKLYDVKISYNNHTISDKIGFRKIETSGKDILLNGEKIFLRGISIHEEIPQDVRRAKNKEDAKQLFGYVRDLNANMVRLAHYPHNENMTRLADSLGIMVWSEIPVYWTIDFESEKVLEKAKTQLQEMITRDKNRASVIIWSVGNETPVSHTRTSFMKSLIDRTRELDNTRLVSAALEVGYNREKNYVDDPLGEITDIVSVNEYLGWYGDLPHAKENSNWEVAYDKPLFISETGAGAKGGFYGEKNERWTEEFQQWYYEETIKMMKRMPDNYSGISPWILTDFRSPRRNHPKYQEGWNRKGLIDDKGNKKKAFNILQKYYEEIEKNKSKL